MKFNKQNIQSIIIRNFNWVKNLKNKVYVVDNGYIPLSRTFVLNTIKYDEWLKRDISYIPDVFDCDDYAMYLKCKISKMFVNEQQKLPGALGFIITTKHAFNFSVDNRGSVVIYDTLKTKFETNPKMFPIFLEIKPGNNLKLIYI